MFMWIMHIACIRIFKIISKSLEQISLVMVIKGELWRADCMKMDRTMLLFMVILEGYVINNYVC